MSDGDDRDDEERRRVPVVLDQQGFSLTTIEEAWRFGEALIRARMVPSSIAGGGAGAVVGIIQAGREIGLPPMFALSNMTFTNGRVGVMGDAAKAVIRARGGLAEGSDFAVTYSGEPMTPEWTCTVTCRPARTGQPVSASFSLAEAIRAGLCRLRDGVIETSSRSGWGTSGPWSTYPQRMLYYRALGFLARDYFSHLLSGAVICEELADYRSGPVRAERDVTPPREPDPLMAMLAAPTTGVAEAAPRQGAPEGAGTEAAMPSQPIEAPSSPAAAPDLPDVEIDPETGEVIPEDLPREPSGDPRDVEGFVHAGKAAAELVDELLKDAPAADPFAATPRELAAEAERIGEAPADALDVAPISRAAREHLVGVLKARGKVTPADALRFLGTLVGRPVRSTEDLLIHEYEVVVRALGEKFPSTAVQEALL